MFNIVDVVKPMVSSIFECFCIFRFLLRNRIRIYTLINKGLKFCNLSSCFLFSKLAENTYSFLISWVSPEQDLTTTFMCGFNSTIQTLSKSEFLSFLVGVVEQTNSLNDNAIIFKIIKCIKSHKVSPLLQLEYWYVYIFTEK